MSWEELCGHTTRIHFPTVDIYFNSYICFLSTRFSLDSNFNLQNPVIFNIQPPSLDFALTQIFLEIIKKGHAYHQIWFWLLVQKY